MDTVPNQPHSFLSDEKYSIADLQELLARYSGWPDHHLITGRCIRMIGETPTLVLMVESLTNKHEIEKLLHEIVLEIPIVVEIVVFQR